MKKVVIIAILAAMVVFAVSCFAVHSYYKDQESKKAFAFNVDDFKSRKAYFGDFIKRNEGDYVWMDSDKAKVLVRIPREWEAFEGSFSALSLKSKDFVPFDGDSKKAPLPSAGCWIDFNVQIDKITQGYTNLVKEMLDASDTFNNTDEKKVKIGTYDALMIISKKENNDEKMVFVKIPKNNFTYKIDSYFFGKDKERCEKEFDDFLNSLVIK